MKQLIVNADGFGFTYGNNRAILEVLAHGFIRSVSVNVTWPAVEEVQNLMRHFPHVTVGVHLNLSVGPSILPRKEIPSLVRDNGEFYGDEFPRRALRGQFNPVEINRELRAQFEVLQQMGVRISHWDGHQDRHIYKGFFEAALELAKEYGIFNARTSRYYPVLPKGPRALGMLRYYLSHPLRIVTHQLAARKMVRYEQAGMRLPLYRVVMQGMGEGAEYKLECWEAMFQQIPSGIGLIICHPGYRDEVLLKYSRKIESREKEAKLLTGEALPRLAEQYDIHSVSYDALSAATDHKQVARP